MLQREMKRLYSSIVQRGWHLIRSLRPLPAVVLLISLLLPATASCVRLLSARRHEQLTDTWTLADNQFVFNPRRARNVGEQQ